MNELEFEARRVRAEVAARLFGGEPDPQAIERFVVEARIGSGAMGVVYRALDPTLDRRVALKVVDGQMLDSERLLDEARALAKVTHPNIVSVFDAGTAGDSVFIATELIDGVSALEWLDEPREIAEIVEVFTAAGRGLAAAHDAGVIHRDFKPANAMIGADGRVCVVDFGLARIDDNALEGAGTPVYMAPEQHRGEGDARSDQFSFCVALYEALAGERPFAGDSLGGLRAEIDAGPPALDAPAHIAAVVSRGLAADPADRFADMESLVVALERDPRKRRRRLIAGSLTIAAVFAAGAVVAAELSEGPSWAERCDATGAVASSRAWSPERESGLRAAFAATDHPERAKRADAAAAAFARRAAELGAARRAACRATHVDGRQSSEVLDLRSACIERRAAAGDELYRLFVDSADRELVGSAARAVDRLSQVTDCEDVDWLRGIVKLPADSPIAEQVAEQEKELQRIEAMIVAGRYGPALERARAVVKAASEFDYALLRARAAYVEADLLDRKGEHALGRDKMRSAIKSAAAAGEVRLEARGWSNLLWIVGAELQRPEEAEAVELSAEAAVLRAGRPTGLARVLDLTIARLRVTAGKADEAEARLAPHLEQVRSGGPIGDPTQPLRLMADVRHGQGRYAEAVELEREAAELAATRWPGSDREASSLESLALTLRIVGEYQEAIEAMRRVVAIREANVGPDSPRIAVALSNLGMVLIDFGQHEEGLALSRRAFEVRSKGHPPDSLAIAEQLNELAAAQHRSRKFEAAAASHREALRIRETRLGAEHFLVGVSSTNLADTMQELGRYDESLKLARRALVIFEKHSGPDHVNLSYPLIGLGSALLKSRQPAAAIAPLERAIELREAAGMGPKLLAQPRFTLAEALWAAGKRERAVAVAGTARDEAERAGAAASELAGEIAAWLEGATPR